MDILKEEKWNNYGKTRLLSRNRLLRPHHRLVTKYFLDFFKNLDPQFFVLEIGCGEGLFMELLRDLGFESVFGIDLSSSMVEKAKEKNLNVELKDIYQLDRSDNYDIILLMDVLEHLEDPEKALRIFYEILKTEGILYLNIPVCDSLALRCWRLIGLKSRLDLVKEWDETHLRAWSKKELLFLLRKSGFKVIKSQRISNRLPFIHRISPKLSEFLQQFTVFGLFGDMLTVVAKKK